jgi:integrase
MQQQTENGAPATVAIPTEATNVRQRTAGKRKRRPKSKGPKLPTMGRHSSGQARVTLNGKVHYLGAFGSLAAQQAYAELLAKWESNGRRPLDPTPDVEGIKPVREVFRLWLAQLDASGRYQRNGAPTSARRRLLGRVEKFLKMHGSMPAHRLTERQLVTYRDELERTTLTRSGINCSVAAVKQGIRWGFERGHFTRDCWLSCSAVAPLSRTVAGHRDRKKAKRAPTPSEVEAVAVAASPIVAAMLRVQFLLGSRPGELCAMRLADIDRSTIPTHGAATFRVPDSIAKTAHHGRSVRYAIPPSALAIIDAQPSRGPGAPVFESPIRSANGKRQWSVGGYRNALLAACERAGVEAFSGHEVRHGTITLACAKYGAFAASSMANHGRLQTTEGYVHRDDGDRYRVAIGLAGGAS